jgi:hypothetical protein
VEVLLVARAVEAEHADAVAELLVGDRDEPAVAEPEQVLRRVEAERGRDPGPRDHGRAERLRRVLHERQAELGELLERRRPAEQVHRHDRARPRRDPRCHLLRVEVRSGGIDVGEDRRGAAPRDRLGGRVEREGRTDHLVARPDTHRVEHEDERVGAVRDSDRLRDAQVVGRLALERLHVRAEDERPGFEDFCERLLELRHERRVLRLHVNEWNPGHLSGW